MAGCFWNFLGERALPDALGNLAKVGLGSPQCYLACIWGSGHYLCASPGEGAGAQGMLRV